MRILLADDHFLVLEGLEVLLSTFEFVEKSQSVLNFVQLKKTLKEDNFDVLLLDIHFGRYDGREIIGEIKEMAPNIKIIALTSHSDIATIKSSVNAGFDGYLLKIDSREDIEKALKTVTNNEKYFSPKTQQMYIERGTSKNKRSEEHTSELQSRPHLVCRLLLEKKNK